MKTFILKNLNCYSIQKPQFNDQKLILKFLKNALPRDQIACLKGGEDIIIEDDIGG